MLSIDWREPAGYEYAETIPAAGFAWEYLRRHDDYRHDYQAMTAHRRLAKDELRAFSERWGLRFPPRSR